MADHTPSVKKILSKQVAALFAKAKGIMKYGSAL